MKKLVLVASIVVFCHIVVTAQTLPNLENGWKPYGSYDGTHLDTVNLMNGNLMLHAPLIPDPPQRGSLKVSNILYATSKDWQVVCTTPPKSGPRCSWQKGGAGVIVLPAPGLSVHRTINNSFFGGEGNPTSIAFGYTIVTPDQATHQLVGVPGTQDGNGEATAFDSNDLSAFHLVLSNQDPVTQVFAHAIVVDRAGNQYQGDFRQLGNCGRAPTNFMIGVPGPIQPMIDDAPAGEQYCAQTAFAALVTDSNGNQITLHGPGNANPTADTLGKSPGLPMVGGSFSTTDYHDCVSSFPIFSALLYSYQDPNGAVQNIKFCAAEIPIQTQFNQHTVDGGTIFEAVTSTDPSNGLHFRPVVTAVLADGTKWVFNYDSYGELIYVGLPTGGAINYVWQTVNYLNCNDGSNQPVSRAITDRTLVDAEGNSAHWHYGWGTPSPTSLTNTVTDAIGNDTVHVFSDQSPQAGVPPACKFYESSTIQYQGAASAKQPLQRVDTAYSANYIAGDAETSSVPSLANVFATDITTTVYPSNKVKKVHRDPDPGLGAGQPGFGNVIRELEYDWGQGAPGALLRETDTVYQWQKNSAYLTAHLLDLPASKVVVSPASGANIRSGCPISASATGSCMAETDYVYDEAAYLTTPQPAVTMQHVAPPYGIRGNLSTTNSWLSTTNSFVSSHTNWYDTGEPYQKIDPFGHTTTISYDSQYYGAYPSQTCSPATGTVTHCVTGVYDFTTGILASFTDQNGQTSNFGYDLVFRISSAKSPVDAANGNLRSTSTFTYSNSFPLTATRQKSLTTTLTDSVTSTYDGVGRVINSAHATPNGPATVATTYDDSHSSVTVSNPYFSTADTTYGTTTTQSDALGRATTVTEQDGSIKSVSYDVAAAGSLGNCVTSTDEAGHQRQTCNDALGRLVEVNEPGTPTNFVANYHANLAADGNFTVLDSSGDIEWESATHGAINTSYSLNLQDDGNIVKYTPTWSTGTATTSGTATYSAQPCLGYRLYGGQTLASGACLQSPNKRFMLIMQTDGNLVQYDLSYNPAHAIFFTAAQGSTSGSYLAVQSDGNLVIYSPSGTALWWTGTASGAGTYVFQVQDQGNLALYKDIWETGTTQAANGVTNFSSIPCSNIGTGISLNQNIPTGSCLVSPSGRFRLVMQSDGNLVLYDGSVNPSSALWSTGSNVPLSAMALSSQVALQTLYFYDALGNLLCVEQHGGVSGTGCSANPSSDASSPWRVRRFTYDSLSRLLTAHNPESGTINYAYDADGNLLQKTSPAPNQTGSATQTISFCYDALHRLTGKAYSAQTCPLASPVVTYSYDAGANAKGKLTSLTDQAGSASYSYDGLGRMTAETRVINGASKSMSYDYNLDGSLKTIHYPSGAAVTYTPDSAGRTLSAVDASNSINYVTSAIYQADGQLLGFVSGNSTGFPGITNTFNYNKRLQPINMSASAPSQTVYSVGYDFHVGNGTTGADNGNVWGITNYKDNSRNQSFTYDSLNRLTSAQNAGTNCAANTLNGKTEYWGNSYTYDPWGNLTNKTVTKCGAENLSAPALVNNQLSGYGYDAAGNMTTDPTDGGLALSYDQENRITGASGYTYTYDADGNRVKKTNGTTGTLYWYMTPGIVAESDLSGALKSEYVFFAGERVARRDLPAGTVAYYFSDHLKTASVITDASGNIKSESDYYPWGGELQFLANDSNHYKFTGQERDETGLDYFGARYYSNGLARFITPDWSSTPIPVPYADFGDPQSLNEYSYVRNVPTSRTDADGHDGCCTSELQELKHLVDEGMAEGRKMIDAMKPATPLLAGGPVVAGIGALAAPSVGAMYLVATNPPVENHPADNPPNAADMSLDALNPPFVPAPPAPGQSHETEHEPEPIAAADGGQQGNGRGGKQDRLRELGKDDKVSSADRGEIKRDQNQIARGTRSTIRVPGSKDLAHRRGKEARKGYNYKHSDLQNKDLHRLQHKHEGYK